MTTTLQALKVLIEHSSLLTSVVKEKLTNGIAQMTDDDVNALGGLFSAEKEQSIATVDKDLEAIDAILKKLEEMQRGV